MRCFLASVQRPTMDSPARWMTASKPDADSGARARAGSHVIWPLPDAAPRIRHTTSYPLAFNDGSKALPIRPEHPLTRILAGMESRQVQLYQLEDAQNRWESSKENSPTNSSCCRAPPTNHPAGTLAVSPRHTLSTSFAMQRDC